jgi:hypothetical protein
LWCNFLIYPKKIKIRYNLGMKNTTKTLLILTCMASSLAFKKGDVVELEAFLNARSSASFMKSSANITATLTKGTKGEILESKKMPSGNFGLKMKVENGPHAGEAYWVYYNVKARLIKLFSDKDTEQTKVSQAKKALLTHDQKAYRAPEEAAVMEAALTAKTLLDRKSVADIVLTPKQPDCKQTLATVTTVKEEDYKETDVVEPYKEVNSSSLQSHSCRSGGLGWDQCKSESGKIEGFKLINNGPNNIVKTNEYYISREMSFEFEDHARSDLKLIVSDSPDDTTSHATYSIMMFFPRTVLPAVKRVGDELEVTLPNKEIVRYNANTKEVIGGVFTEGPMKQDPTNRNKAFPANLKYTGEGVMIRADKTGDLPYGDTETNTGAKVPSSSTATVSKKGFKDCKIPAKDIWYTDYNKGSNVFIKPELASDAGLDAFIKTKCGFSVL